MIRERAKKAVGTRKSVGSSNKGSTVIENIAQTKRLAETTLGVGPPVTDSSGALVISNRSNAVEDEKLTNTQSGSQVRTCLVCTVQWCLCNLLDE